MSDERRRTWPTVLGISLAALAALYVALTLYFMVGGDARCSATQRLGQALRKSLFLLTLGNVRPQVYGC